MGIGYWARWSLVILGSCAWAAIFIAPLVTLYVPPSGAPAASPGHGSPYFPPVCLASIACSAGLAAAIASVAVILGYLPGKLIGTSGADAGGRRRQAILLFLLLAPLLMPSYVLYYAWSLMLSPTSPLGQHLSNNPDAARIVWTVITLAVLMLWHWPLAALILAQGWRNMDWSAMENARLDAGPLRRFVNVTLPLLAGPLLLAWAVCFMLALSEFATFHLSGVRTIGTELAVLFEQTGRQQVLARASWPMIAPALLLAVALWREIAGWESPVAPGMGTGAAAPKGAWAVLAVLLRICLGGPLAMLLVHMDEWGRFLQFGKLHKDDLAWSAAIAVAASLISLAVAGSALAFDQRRNRPSGSGNRQWARGNWRSALSAVMHVTILLTMFLPPALVAVALLKAMACLNLPAALRQSWLGVSAGLTLRYAAVALILLRAARGSQEAQLTELAQVDGASWGRTWLHVHLPRLWPLPVGAAVLITMLGMTEVPATMMLLPPGLPSFAQRLLNQMHYARDQEVIVSCLLLFGAYLVLAAVIVALLRWNRAAGRESPIASRQSSGRRKGPARFLVLFCLAMSVAASGAGCRSQSSSSQPEVLASFGRTGGGNGEFTYPRAIDLAADGTLFVCDKTGRIQHLKADGEFLGSFAMPEIEQGKPTGITVGPDGNVWVADTHYHRVMVFSPDGKLVRQFGRFGKEGGCFVFPTDVAFAGEGPSLRVFVSEYGGNDRVSVFSADGEFLSSFGRPGSGSGEFSRPAALAVDPHRNRLYVADACNHRIAVYDLQCHLIGYVGSAGTEPGQFRYPYGLSLLADGALVVCEFGNNRLQIFRPEGSLLKSVKVLGTAGRELGQLAYPWGVVVDSRKRAYVVDAGNNRVQVWQL